MYERLHAKMGKQDMQLSESFQEISPRVLNILKEEYQQQRIIFSLPE